MTCALIIIRPFLNILNYISLECRANAPLTHTPDAYGKIRKKHLNSNGTLKMHRPFILYACKY